MQTVGIKELKARLSEYVRLARAGETVLVTDRGEVVAELRSAGRPIPPGDDRAASLIHLARRGIVSLPAADKIGWRWEPPAPVLAAEEVTALIEGIRRERTP